MLSGKIFGSDTAKKNDDASKSRLKKKKSWLGPLPHCVFGPKARTEGERKREETLNLENQKLTWLKPPENILIIKRIGMETNASFQNIATWLIQDKKLKVFVESNVLADSTVKSEAKFEKIFKHLQSFSSSYHSRKNGPIDLIITIGGDGTLLYAASLFQTSMPPVIAFNAGSLGFLTAHELKNYKSTVESVLAGNTTLMLRSRLRCKVDR